MKITTLILLSFILFSCLQRPIPDAINGVKYEIIESSILFTSVVTHGYYDSAMISKFLKGRNTDKMWYFHTPENSERGEYYYSFMKGTYFQIYMPDSTEFNISIN